MNSLSRRRFLQAGAAGSAIFASQAMSFDIGGALSKAAPYLQHAQPLIQSLTFSEADEIKMGESYYDQYVEKSGGKYQDEQLQKALKQFSSPLMETSRRSALPWDIVLLNNEEVNAWALPGGKLAVNSGLLKQVKNPEELASVIAHEIGHSELSHGVSQIKTKSFMSALSGAGKQALMDFGGATGALTSQALTAIEGPMYDLINKGYSRSNEFEADAHIVKVFNQIGMDARKADDFFVTLDKLYPSKTDITTSLFSTHPVTRDRIQKLEQLASEQKTVKTTAKLKGWNELKEAFPQQQS